MTSQTFELRGELIALGALIKAAGMTDSGGAAKSIVSDGAVRVNGEIETRRRRKVRAGDIVTVGEVRVEVCAGTMPAGSPTHES